MSGLDGVFGVNDTLDAILLGLFFFGFVFVVLTLALGLADIGFGGAHDVGGHDVGHVLTHDLGDPGQVSGHDAGVGHLNVGTILAFVMWFGGVTYLFKNAVGLPALVSLALGLAGGFGAGWLIFRFLRLMKSKERVYDAAQERLSGAAARVTSSIRAGGTGEIVYELHGVRQVSAARAADGGEIPRGSEVIVIRRDRGVAYVEPWQALSDDEEWEARFALASSSANGHGPTPPAGRSRGPA